MPQYKTDIVIVKLRHFRQHTAGTDADLKRILHAKYLHLDGTSHVSHPPRGLIQANAFTINKPCGMKFN